MATDEVNSKESSEKLTENLGRIEELSERFAAALAKKQPIRPSLQGPGQDFYMKTMGAYWSEMMENPGKMLENQVEYWGRTLRHAVEAQQAMLTQGTTPEDHTPKDPRFRNPLWDTHPYFNYLKQQYLITSEAMNEAVEGLEGLDDSDRRRVTFFTQQIVDLMSPTNFLATNPDALERAVETEGQSLVDGLENMIRDLERHDGELVVTLSDPDAFKVGENLGTAEGNVVFRNRMMELIQYKPTTEKVYSRPLLIFPPWINKFYILDLKPENSLIRWIVDQGFTLYVVSWINPDESYADVGMEDYVEEGFFTAIDEVRAMTGQDKINVIGYCIAGTTLALTLSLLKQRGEDKINSATFFTALTDFSDRGEVGVFLDDDFVDGIEAEVEETGILPSLYMSRTFSYLRSRDLVYGPAIKSYMMGAAPPAFDLLYWNGDSTNLPGRMATQYLRGLCQRDEFAGEGKGFPILGTRARIEEVEVPICAIACETDHIAAWKSSYRGMRKMGSKDKTFILSESGHIAGIVNPPSKKKYGHYTNEDWPEAPEDWLEAADKHEGTWWHRWGKWLAKRSGKKIEAREVGDSDHPPLEKAPGTYVVASPKV
ncbi:class I poly(R)-hydroxyalkanoic acid synthase [Maritimibacter sp. UBA3975]|uniref:PHA/PHB synthase family protein n=1 Tax=Maritimibacter sp. UBA3975 TaxID=1946833 RepID=UPI000C0ACB76|nr:class I poly(R)-hydroxyalkanoic acid synthase [Maritimibacter sp. UBA3975]MAM60947.1 class I poly(R)-hydroxyalkanoic acid synthase [Maritimibacter sp.]|tara:strand:+ start:4334 stop:6130 length:1797 start_codon:yes stop_codon:yes gene_type:complete